MKIKTLFISLLFVTLIGFGAGCGKDDGDRLPLPPTDITIDPNSTIYQELNIVGGWTYLGIQDGVEPPSRGIIVYRLSMDQFMAFERTPPFKPDSCCNTSGTVCTSLVVDNFYPFVMDTCTNSKYLILDGSPVSGPSTMTLGIYVTEYYANQLYIHD
ncbi:MAG: hypothetical protein RBS55_03450 [Bacteroidales bacterium]|jgi:hypothetical protein|nr:hypothetical protein [Bacteroidales bacterium]